MKLPRSSPVRITIKAVGVVKTTAEFVSAISDLHRHKPNRKFWYRGLSRCDYRLIPTVGRPQEYAGKKTMLSRDDEVDLLHRFRRRVYPHLGRVVSPGEALFLARHHKLPTRLLDWTANALYALYFACAANLCKHAKVWVMHRPPHGENDRKNDIVVERQSDEEELFNLLDPPSAPSYMKIIYPFYNSPRLVAQDGAFTIHSDPTKSIESYETTDFEKENLHLEAFYFWCIPADNKVGIIKELSGLGITERAVYPDLDGLAKSIWETEVLWKDA
jgi:FRG domain